MARASRCLPGETIAAYAAGGLRDSELEAVEEHIDECAACRRLVSEVAEAGLSIGERATFSPAGSEPGAPVGDAIELLAAGTAVGRYEIDALLGAGGMGVVYAAHDPELGRRVALKALRRERFAATRDAEEILRREAKAMARLAHPNVVGVYDLVAAQGTLFVAMELVDGCTLRQWVRQDGRTSREVIAAFVQAGNGLEAAHEQGIVHRDFKPDNVLIGRSGRVQVSDFGLARHAGGRSVPPSAHRLDATRARAAGTPAYMSPEQRDGHPATARSDQYAFCVALQEALTGELPEAIASSRDGGGTAEGERRGDRIPGRARRVLARGLRADPAARYPSMRALLADLTRDRAARWRRAGLGALAVVAVAGAAAALRRAPTVVCQGSEARLAGVWDRPRRAAVARAFGASGKPFAADALEGVAGSLDAYARQWAEQRTEACEATRVRGEQSEALLDLRMACLDDRKRELGALVGVLAQADDEVVTRAFAAAQSLTPPATCDDARALTAGARRPVDPATAARVEDVRQRLATAEALGAAGKYQEALPVATGAASDAEALGDGQLRAEALLALARAQQATGDWATVEATLRRTASLADAAGDDRLRVRALAQLVSALADLGHLEGFPALQEETAAAMTRAGRDELLEAQMLKSFGIAANALGRYEDSRALFERVRAFETKTYGPESWQVGLTLSDLAAAYPGADPRGLALAQQALAIELRSLGPGHPRVADAEMDVGVSLAELGKTAEAETHLRRALEVAESALGAGHVKLTWYLDDLAQCLVDLGRFDEAIPLYRRALALRESVEHPATPGVDSLAGLGLAYAGKGEREQAMAVLERAADEPDDPADDHTLRAEAELALARLLDAAHPGSPRALSLARKAAATFETADPGPRADAFRDEARAWLAKREPGAKVTP